LPTDFAVVGTAARAVTVLAGVAVLLARLGGGGWFLFGRPSPMSPIQPIKPPGCRPS
jgi:hypothetical protein